MRRYWTALLGLVGCLVATQATAERRVALVVGNAQYLYTQALPNPRNDAQDIAASLQKLGFDVSVGYNLDQANFARTIDDFAHALEGADVGLFFFAGHGLQLNDKNYLVSTSAKLESAFLVPSEAIELDAIIRLMESKTGVNLIFLDACRNNPLAENLKRTIASTNRSVALGRGLARIEPTGHDTLVAFSAAPGQEAADGPGRNSPFTSSLLRRMPQPGVEVSVMLKEVAADVREQTKNAQRPQQLSDMTRTFYFIKPAPLISATAPVSSAPTVPPSNPTDVAFWQSAAAANECESIRAYIRRFPDGAFLDLALISERRLCASTKEGAEATQSSKALSAPTAMPPSPEPLLASAPPKPADQNMSVAVVTPIAPLQPASVTPIVAPNSLDIARDLQRELLRVGCGAGKVDPDGNWSATSRDALKSFNDRTRSVTVIDRATPEALVAVRSVHDRVCPETCDLGMEMRNGECIAAPQSVEHPRRASRPQQRANERHSQRSPPVEPPNRTAVQSSAKPPAAEVKRRGESDFYVGTKHCKSTDWGGSPQIVCP